MSAAPEWPLVSIVFLAFNRRDALATSLMRVLTDLDYPADRLEVIVVDNASTDGTGEMVRKRFARVQVIRTPENVGTSAWNLGLATARGAYCLLLDDDCYITGDALRRAVEAAQAEHADLVSYTVESGVQPGYLFNDEYPTGLLAFWGCAALFSRRAVEELGGYDPEIFIWANEMELTARLLDRGMKHLFLPEVTAVHMKGPSNPDERFDLRATRINSRHWAYIAGKLLRSGDAALALASLTWQALFAAAFEDRRALAVVPDVIAGFVRGLRRRAPVRPAVSRAYRGATREFASPLQWARPPRELVRGLRHDARRRDEREAAKLRFYARHRHFYPEGCAALVL